MEVLNSLAQGFALALTMQNLLWCFVGVTLGTAVGVLPGIGPAVVRCSKTVGGGTQRW